MFCNLFADKTAKILIIFNNHIILWYLFVFVIVKRTIPTTGGQAQQSRVVDPTGAGRLKKQQLIRIFQLYKYTI